MSEASDTSTPGGTSKEKESPIYVKELGLTQIDGHSGNHPFIADVVFVHGLQGHPKRTWQSTSPAKAHKHFRERLKGLSLSGAGSEKGNAHEGLFWPAEVLPRDFNDVRILTYGYDSIVTKAFKGLTSKNGIFHHGQSFLEALSGVRLDCGDRPIIFVAHSLGGIIVKQALIEARARKQADDQSFHDVYDNTHGIIFFGTPHRGSNIAGLALSLSNVAQDAQMDTNNAILIDLDPKSGSTKLEELRLNFEDVLTDNQRAQKLRVFSFHEEEGMTSVKPLGNKVVPHESSSLDSRRYGNDTIHANHMGMCRFKDENDDGYKKFKVALQRFIVEIKTQQRNATEESLENDAIRKAELLHCLDYAERRSRQHQLQNIDAKEESFSWIWSSSSFMDWLSSSEGLYWIFGKPGSGKSTLIDYLAHNNRTKLALQQYRPTEWIVLRFFFDFRGGKGVTNSFEGLLRSLLYQLIREMPQVDVLGLDDSENYSFSGWPEQRLRSALRRSLENVKIGVCILVDGLDEYEGSVLELIQFLKSLANNNYSQENSVKIVVSSRPEPVPSQLLQHLPRLSMSDHNTSGIQAYCSLTLGELEAVVLEGLDVSEITQTIAKRAEGVFLWARFALDQLILGHSSAETLEEMLLRLDAIPSDLEEVYDRMLRRMEPLAKKECMVMLRLVCFAKRSLLWQEHLMATDIAMGKDVVISEHIRGGEDSANASELYKIFAKRLRAKAVGLLELVKDEDEDQGEDEASVVKSKLKLIHRSVSTYLDKKGWQILGESETCSSVGHQSLYVKTCTGYLKRLLRHPNFEKITSHSDWKDCFKGLHLYGPQSRTLGSGPIGVYPFLTYAVTYIFRHAYDLERHGASSYPLLHGSLTEKFFFLHFYVTGPQSYGELCMPCALASDEVLFDSFDAIYVAFLHGLTGYCKSDLANRSMAPGPIFWDRALRCTIFSGCRAGGYDSLEALELVSWALQNVTTVQQHHIEDLIRTGDFWYDFNPEAVELVLRHESVKDLRLTDCKEARVTLLWFFTRNPYSSEDNVGKFLDLFIEAAKRRGEDVRQRCGPEGNLVETWLKQEPSYGRKGKLRAAREYYKSMSWPFEYDLNEIERE